MKDEFSFYDRRQYISQLVHELDLCGPNDQIAIATMAFEPETKEIKELAEAVAAASVRGAKTLFCIDYYSYSLFNILPSQMISLLPKSVLDKFNQRMECLDTIQRSGSKCTLVNKPRHRFSLPLAGRSHIKVAVINDHFYIGGHNLRKPNEIDTMVRVQDRPTADYIFSTIENIISTGSVQAALGQDDIRREVNDKTSLLIDVGIKNQSLILDTVIKLIDEANERIFLACPYFPGGITGKHLRSAAKRGVKVDVIYNHPATHDRIERFGHHIYNYLESRLLPHNFVATSLPKSSAKLHAKLVASEKSVILGSHNLVSQGVVLGTAEIALHLSDNPTFIEQSVSSITSQLK